MNDNLKVTWERAYAVVDPQINAAGVHTYPFDELFPIDVRFFTNGGRHNIRMNRHDYCEVMYVCHGRSDFRVQDRLYKVEPGDLIVIGSDVYHTFVGGSTVRVAVLFFQPDLVRGATVGEDVEYLVPFLAQCGTLPHVISGKAGIQDEIYSLLRRIKHELPAGTARARLSVKTYLKMILVQLVNHYADAVNAQQALDRKQRAIQRLQPLFEHLEEHYHEHIRVQQAARICCMSNSHLMYFFKQVTGQSFLSYLNHFRVAKAQAMLASTDKSVADVSQELGFCDQSHFGQVFRRLVGMTPLVYRSKFSGIAYAAAAKEVGPADTVLVASSAWRKVTLPVDAGMRRLG